MFQSKTIKKNSLIIIEPSDIAIELATASEELCKIEAPLSRHQIKNPETAKVYLVSAKIKTKKNGKVLEGTFMHIISLPNTTKSDEDICKIALESYRLRWKIEEVHRQVKTDFGWGKIQLLKFNRLRAMNTLLWLALGFIYELDTWKY